MFGAVTRHRRRLDGLRGQRVYLQTEQCPPERGRGSSVWRKSEGTDGAEAKEAAGFNLAGGKGNMNNTKPFLLLV